MRIQKMRTLALLTSTALAWAPALNCEAQSFNGTKPFLCAMTDVSQCTPDGNCARTSISAANIPQFVSIDVQQGLVTATDGSGGVRTSKITQVEHPPQLLRLSGGDGDAGWVAEIEESSGKLTIAALGDEVGFVIFGACILK
jgi:hypothetical protein